MRCIPASCSSISDRNPSILRFKLAAISPNPMCKQAVLCPSTFNEVDVWSYGCLLLELLTLQVPYAGLSNSEYHQLLQCGFWIKSQSG
ncbi:hypothetical protein MRB53_003469 [Persea americana]|uniref:Uncharacterized protein n=1 Tax=Persea americana TaxID=3435 RepID=A0ACC2MXP0_PERAE|nr:hypothetical protein MRB53_003469 [Persea americana]